MSEELITEARNMGEFMARRKAEYTGGPKPFKHNGLEREAAFPWLTDEEMAGTVRMLTRGDLAHEAIVCAARDRILHLSQENERIATQLSQALRELGEARAEVGDYAGSLSVQARVVNKLTAERDAALRSTAELTRERDGVMRIPNPTPDQIEYLEKLKAASSYDPNLVIGGPSNPCSKIFDHKWLDPNCVENGCQSLVLQSANAELRGALEGLVAVVGAMRVPQTLADAAIQVNITVGPAYTRARTALASSSTKET